MGAGRDRAGSGRDRATTVPWSRAGVPAELQEGNRGVPAELKVSKSRGWERRRPTQVV